MQQGCCISPGWGNLIIMMTLLKVLFFLFPIGLFVLRLISYASLRKDQRFKSTVIFWVLVFIFLCFNLYVMVDATYALVHKTQSHISLLDIFPNNSIRFIPFVMYFIMLAPPIIGFIYLRIKLKKPFLQLKHNRGTFFGVIASFILVTLFFLWRIRTPIKFRISDGQPVYDADYYRLLTNLVWIYAIGVISLFLFLAAGKPTLSTEGLFYGGKFWTWDDFDYYDLKVESKHNDLAKLRLHAKNILELFSVVKYVELEISIKDIEQAERILEPKLLKGEKIA